MSRALLAAFLVLLCARTGVARADGAPPAANAFDSISHFESFVLASCSPCVREVYLVATVPVPSISAPVFPGAARASAAAATTRPGELRFELLRAYPLGLESRQRFALRVALGVAAGSEGTLYPLGAGVLDEEEVPVLADALARMGKTAPRTGDATMQVVDTEFHADSVRMGTVRAGNDVFAYVQVAQGEMARFGQKQVWELPAMYLPAKDLSALENAVVQAVAKMRAVRGR